MMYLDQEELRRAAGWPGVKGGARERLMDKLQGELPGFQVHVHVRVCARVCMCACVHTCSALMLR